MPALAVSSDTLPLLASAALVCAGAGIQVAIGAGLSVVCGPLLLLWLGPSASVPLLLGLNLLVSVLATAADPRRIRWRDVGFVSAATLVGCAVALLVPPLPDLWLTLLTAAALVAVALPRPPAPGREPSASRAAAMIAAAGLATGALTVWTATPGPITPVALARAGRAGSEIRRTMQPISIVGYGAALGWAGASPVAALGTGPMLTLVAATVMGTGAGFVLRKRIGPERVVLLVRVTAAISAALLLAVAGAALLRS